MDGSRVDYPSDHSDVYRNLPRVEWVRTAYHLYFPNREELIYFLEKLVIKLPKSVTKSGTDVT